MIEKQLKWWGNREEWGRVEGTKEAEITSVKISDSFGRETNRLKLGDSIIIKVEFLVREKVKEPHFGAAIFREDTLYCYGPNTLLDGHTIKRLNKGKGWFSIEHQDVPLMPGNYYISVAIWDRKEFVPYSFHIACYKFEIMGLNREKQLLFMPYICKLNKWQQFFTRHKAEEVNIATMESKWGHKFNLDSSKLDISSVEFLDSKNKRKDYVVTNEKLKINIRLKPNQYQKNSFIWIGVFRSDTIYCCGASRRLGKNEKQISIIYPRLQLLDGTYYLSVGIWRLNQTELLLCHHGVYSFAILSNKMDHGSVYIDHKWQWELP